MPPSFCFRQFGPYHSINIKTDRRETLYNDTRKASKTRNAEAQTSRRYYTPVKIKYNKLCGRPPQYAPEPCKLTFDLLILKVVSESRVTWATSVPILVFLGLSVLDLGPMYVTDRHQARIIA